MKNNIDLDALEPHALAAAEALANRGCDKPTAALACALAIARLTTISAPPEDYERIIDAIETLIRRGLRNPPGAGTPVWN